MRQIIVILLTVFVAACGGSSGYDTTGNPPLTVPPSASPVIGFLPKSEELMHADAESVGLNVSQLTGSFLMAESQPGLRSLLVIKNQKLVAEQYFNGAVADDLLHLRSVTKTVTAAILGIAIEEGIINGLDNTIGEYLQQDYPWLDEQKSAITIAQLLTMSSGFLWDEDDGSEFDEWINAEDPVAHLLERPLSEAPGTRFNYNSAGVHLIAVILDKAMDGESAEFAMARFFQPLGIGQIQWERLADGRFNGASGLQLSAIDIAKVGVLLNGNGAWEIAEGELQQVIPVQWLNQMKAKHVAFNDEFGSLQFRGFGYLWWLGQHTRDDTLVDFQLAWGWGGQFVLTAPEDDLVIVANNDWFVAAPLSNQQADSTLDIMLEGVLRAVE